MNDVTCFGYVLLIVPKQECIPYFRQRNLFEFVADNYSVHQKRKGATLLGSIFEILGVCVDGNIDRQDRRTCVPIHLLYIFVLLVKRLVLQLDLFLCTIFSMENHFYVFYVSSTWIMDPDDDAFYSSSQYTE